MLAPVVSIFVKNCDVKNGMNISDRKFEPPLPRRTNRFVFGVRLTPAVVQLQNNERIAFAALMKVRASF